MSMLLTELKPWLLATRPKTLLLSMTPIFVGSALAGASANSIIILFALLSSLCIQIGTNLINDALDFKHGADHHRLGPVRVTQSGLLTFHQVFAAGIAFLLLALVFGIPLMIHGGMPLIFLLCVSALLGYLYTGGPFPLAYWGLGELFIVLFFGLASTCALYYLQTGILKIAPVLAGLQLGLLAAAPCAINNLRDIRGDALAHKRTLAVRYGIFFARCEIAFLLLAPFLLGAIWCLWDKLWMGILPVLFLFIPAATLASSVWKSHPSRAMNNLLGKSALLQFAFGMTLILGFFLS